MCLSSGSPAVVGKTAYTGEDFRGSVGAFCGIIRTQPPHVPEYLACWFRSPAYLAWRDGQARGANIQNLRFSQLGQLRIAIPAVTEQKRIATALREQMGAVERARTEAAEQLEIISRLPAALLRRAFAGEL